MDKSNFELRPLKGYGLLNFGCSVEKVKSLANIYGEIVGGGPMYNDEAWEKTVDIMVESGGMNREELENRREEARREGERKYRLFLKNNLVFFFNDDKLEEIRVPSGSLPAYLGGEDIFKMFGESAVQYIAKAIGENPYMTDDGMFFIKNCIAFGGYFSSIQDNKIKWSGPPNKPFDRDFVMGSEGAVYGFDPETTFVYKIVK